MKKLPKYEEVDLLECRPDAAAHLANKIMGIITGERVWNGETEILIGNLIREEIIRKEKVMSPDFVIDNTIRRRGDCSSCPQQNCHTYSKDKGAWICLTCFVDKYKCKISDLKGVCLSSD